MEQNVRPEDFDPTQFAEMSEEQKAEMENLDPSQRTMGASVIRKTPQTQIYVNNSSKAEEIFNELFGPYNMSITQLLNAPKKTVDGQTVVEENFPSHLPIEISPDKHITIGDAILFCTTSPVCIDRSDAGNPYITGYLDVTNPATGEPKHKQVSIDYKLGEEEYFTYVEEIIIYDCYILQKWSSGYVEMVVLKDFMDKPSMMILAFPDERGQLAISVMQ